MVSGAYPALMARRRAASIDIEAQGPGDGKGREGNGAQGDCTKQRQCTFIIAICKQIAGCGADAKNECRDEEWQDEQRQQQAAAL